MIKHLTDITEVIDLYDNFIIDVFGVVHDGMDKYHNSEKTVEYLNTRKKNYVFLSNAPRPTEVLYKKIEELNLPIPHERLITSGMFFINIFQSDKIYSNAKYFVLGEETNRDLLKDLNVQRVEDITQADFMLSLMFTEDPNTIPSFDETFAKALKLKIKLVCPNPDKIVHYGNTVRYTAGFFADRYKKMGGEVIYFGKPFAQVYDYIFDKYKFDKKRTLAIGDGLETDILGANSIGIDSLLIRGGIHVKEENIQALCSELGATPTYICDYFGTK